MSHGSRGIRRFWLELKRRRVFRIVAMYAGAAFVIIEVTNNIVEPLGLPAWLPTVVILLLIVGFPIIAILSWIFDLTPEGVKKTISLEAVEESQEEESTGRRKLRPSNIVIAILVIAVVILSYPKIFSNDSLKSVRDQDGKVSIAVLPFENLSGDTLYNIWQGGFQNLLISTLSNSEELAVRKYQAVNDVLKNNQEIDIASFSSVVAKDLADKLDTRTLILGNLLKAGSKIRINAQLLDAETEEIYKTYQIDGDTENEFFVLADSLAGMIRNYVEIKSISDKYLAPEMTRNLATTSSEAFKNYIRGWDAFRYVELGSAANWFAKAVEIDSTFINAYVFGAYANLMNGRNRQAKSIVNKVSGIKATLNTEQELMIRQLQAYFFETPRDEIEAIKQLLEIDKLNPLYWHQLGFAYYKLFEYDMAVKSWEEIFIIHEQLGTNYQNPYVYFLMGDAYHKLEMHDEEEKILALGHRIYPNAIMIQQHQAICAYTKGETQKAEKILVEYKSIRQDVLHCTEAMISSGIGTIYSSSGQYDEAEAHYREAIADDPENVYWTHEFAWFLIDNEINIEEGIRICDGILSQYPDYWPTLDAKGWALYKQGKYEEALTLLKDSWDLKPAYSHNGYMHIQEVEKALAAHNTEM